MPQAQHSVTINKPPEAVFAFLVDGEKCTEWRPGVLDIKRISGDGGVGTRYAQGVRGPMGRRISADYEVTACEPNAHMEFQTVTGPARPHGRYDLEGVDGSTRLTFALDAKVGGLAGVFMTGMVQKTMDSEVEAIERLKTVLEGQPSQQEGPSQSTAE